MKYFFKSVWWILSRTFALLGIGGTIAGTISTVPGADETKLGGLILAFLSAIFNWALEAIYNDPIWIGMCLTFAAILRWVVIYPHVQNLRNEIEEERRSVRSRLKNKSGKK